ncbi:MAG: Ig-like domain-containing protein [Bacteroidales bacterium]
MHTFAKRLLLLAVGVAVAASIIVSSGFIARASNPHLAVYSPATDRILWFVQISDTHIGVNGSTDSDRLRWVVTTGKSVINPSFIVATGDLTDSTNGNIFGYPNGPYQAEWDQYKSIVDPYVNASFYYDIPGNHDGYNDADFSYYLTNSVQGRATGKTQLSWTQSLPSGEKYLFLGVNTADNTGAPFSLSFPYGDHAGLDSTELSFIQQQLNANASANLAMVFGHHPVTDTGASGDTWLFYGHQDFIRYLDTFKASVYGYGHTHAYSQVLFKGNTYTGLMAGDGVAYNNIASLGKSSSSNYSVTAIDCNGVSSVGATAGTWPVVLITAPVDALLGGATNPYAYAVPAASDNPIRALVFDAAASPAVTYRIDSGPTWYPMTRVSGPLWQGTWNASALAAGDHTIEVRAVGSNTVSDAITVAVTSSVNHAPVANDDSYTTPANTPLSVAASGVLANDTDADGNALTATRVAVPSHGSLTLSPNGSFTYTPTVGYSGSDSFTYTASDGTATSNIATATLTITAAPPPPTNDTVTITSATYTRRTTTLAVQAKSSAQPNATLTVDGYGQMTWNSKSKVYTYQKKVSPAPASVSVTSSLGGSATSAVRSK